jgi:hypothetical protein
VGSGGFPVHSGTVTISGLAVTGVSSPGPVAIEVGFGPTLTAADDTISDNDVDLYDAGADRGEPPLGPGHGGALW